MTREELIVGYVLGSTSDDYESVETLIDQSKYIDDFKELAPTYNETIEQIRSLLASGELISYVYSKQDKAFVVSKFELDKADDFWFLNRNRHLKIHSKFETE